VSGTDRPPGNVVAVKRRSPIVLLILAGAALIAGCATFSDNDLAARVDGAEYTRDELVAELRELGATDEQLINADIARGQVSGWITERVSEASDPTLVADAYANGVLESGSVCLEAVGVPTRAEAEAVIDELESGASFTDIFAPFNVNDQLAQTRRSNWVLDHRPTSARRQRPPRRLDHCAQCKCAVCHCHHS